MLKNNKFIERIEKEKGVLSLMELDIPYSDFANFVDGRNFELVYSVTSMNFEDMTPVFHNKIYKTRQDFYLSLFIGEKDNICVNIYYDIKQLNELKLFTSQLLKEYKKTK